jgi:hypothetical protein
MTESVIAEIIAALIVGIIIGTYRKFFLPFIKEHFTEKVHLRKKWKTEVDFGSGKLHGIKLELSKLGNDINGELEFISGTHTGENYPIIGHFRSNILTFVYKPSDPKSTSQGSGTFTRLNDGKLLQGCLAFYSQNKNIINTVECKFEPL